MSGEEFQVADYYPPAFNLAVQPKEVDPNECDHEATNPVCHCVHDWRINWGNVAKVGQKRSLYVTDSP